MGKGNSLLCLRFASGKKARENAPRREKARENAHIRNLVPRAFPFWIGSNEVAGNDEILFRLVPMPVPGHGAQIGSRAPTRTHQVWTGPRTFIDSVFIVTKTKPPVNVWPITLISFSFRTLEALFWLLHYHHPNYMSTILLFFLISTTDLVTHHQNKSRQVLFSLPLSLVGLHIFKRQITDGPSLEYLQHENCDVLTKLVYALLYFLVWLKFD